MDNEFKEMVMGHVLSGSREAYFDRKDLWFFMEQYQKINFGREAPGSGYTKLKAEMDKMRMQKDTEIERLKTIIREIQKDFEELSRVLPPPKTAKELEEEKKELEAKRKEIEDMKKTQKEILKEIKRLKRVEQRKKTG